MSTIAEKTAALADLLESLGGVAPGRVRLHPAPGIATEQDVVEIHSRERRLYELVDGALVEKMMGFRESTIACVLIRLLGAFVREYDLGIVAGEAGMLRLAHGLVRIPDVSFVTWAKFPDLQVPADPIPDLAPDLAVEVLSAGNTPREMLRKVSEYFAAGVRLVWLIDAATETAKAYVSPTEFLVVQRDGELDGRDVVPGFRVALSTLFAEMTRATKK
ncbi:MAG: Uma2 family endonuclease [Planctomycetaceae bacterium]|nr:Uma2 family endonuclease [Planctomycetaceae bacterium]